MPISKGTDKARLQAIARRNMMPCGFIGSVREIRLTIQIRNNFVLFVKIVMGHRIVDLGQLDGFMGVAFDTSLIQ